MTLPEVTAENLATCNEVRGILKERFGYLEQEVKHYPVLCQFLDYRTWFHSRGDILTLINHLEVGVLSLDRDVYLEGYR